MWLQNIIEILKKIIFLEIFKLELFIFREIEKYKEIKFDKLSNSQKPELLPFDESKEMI